MSMLEHALQYAGRGWRVFRLTGYKTPFKGSHGFKDGTVDVEVIERWWSETPRANIGLATGGADNWHHNIVVFDADGPGGLGEIKKAAARAGQTIPRTLVAKTSRGFHFFFQAPAGTTIKTVNARRAQAGEDGLDIKANGAYVVLPPSVNARTGFQYVWANYDPTVPAGRQVAVMPAWLVEFCHAHRLAQKKGPPPALSARGTQNQDSLQGVKSGAGLHDMPPGQVPTLHSFSCPESMGTAPRKSRLADQPSPRLRLASRALSAERRSELGEFLSALRRINADCGYDQWFELGAAIHDFDPSAEGGLAIFKAWSRSPACGGERYDTPEAQEACEKKWVEYGIPKPGVRLITKATIYGLANQAIALERKQESGVGSSADGRMNGVAGLPSIFTAPSADRRIKQIHFPDTDKDGNPKGTTTNAGLAIDGLGVVCRKDLFHEKLTVEGAAIDAWAGGLSDDVVLMLRQVVKAEYGFDPGERNMRDAAVQRCLDHQFNPVLDYLDGLKWDGVRRIGGWVVDYLGASDTALNREFGRLMLIAAVRRARVPGTKFDQIVVWEGKEGTNKSTALKILAGAENFSDQNILSVGDREQQEAMTGVWLYEIAEMAGLKKADIERVKQFASRTEDRARPAYGRLRVDRLRQCVFVGTTNKDIYLQSDTGNRRFWPITTAHIDVVRLAADRDQLWAEAAHVEARGGSIELHPRFWKEAGEQQEARLEGDPWREPVEFYLNTLKEQDTTSYDVLEFGVEVEKPQINQWAQTRVARVLRELGWERYQKRIGNGPLKWRYRKTSGLGGDSGDKKA